MEDAFDAVSRDAAVYLIRGDGQILAASERSMIGGMEPSKTGGLSYRTRIKDTPLTLRADFSDDVLLSVQQNMVTRTVLLLLVIALVAIVISFLLSHALSRRLWKVFAQLSDLTPENAAQVVSEGSLVSEIDRIQGAFFDMSKRVETLLSESVEAERRERELVLSRENARFALLQAQINPHFLYNSFEAIAFMIRKDEKDKAIGMLGSLSAMLRYAVRTGETIAPLREELRYAQTYMEIMALRYEGLLSFSFDFEPETEQLMVVKFTLQPILENAITHGFRPRGGRGRVTVTGTVAGERLLIAVRDDGVGMEEDALESLRASLQDTDSEGETGRHIGLRNIHGRIRSLYGSGYGLEISSRLEGGCVVTIMMPRVSEQS